MNRSVTSSGNLVWQQCGHTSWPIRTAHDVKPRAQSWTRSRCSLKGLCASSPRCHRAATSGPLRCQMSGSSSSNVWTWKKHRRCRRPDPRARPCRISFKYPQLSRHRRTMLKPGKCCDSQASRWPRTPVAWRTAVVCATFFWQHLEASQKRTQGSPLLWQIQKKVSLPNVEALTIVWMPVALKSHRQYFQGQAFPLSTRYPLSLRHS